MGLAVFFLVIVFVPMFIAVAGIIFVKATKLVTGCVFLDKAGDQVWKAFVPFYNNLALLNLGFEKKSALILFIADIASFVLMYLIYFATTLLSGIFSSMESVLYGSSYHGTPEMPAPMMIISIISMLIVYFFCFIRTVVFRMRTYALARTFNQEKWFCILCLFFPLILSIILCFKRERYTGDVIKLFGPKGTDNHDMA